MSTAERRLAKIAAGLSPQEAVLACVAAAHAYGSLAAYVDAVAQGTTANPLTALSSQAAAWVRRTSPDLTERELAARIERTVRATLVRWMLVTQFNEQLEAGRPSDEIQLELLTELADCLLRDRTAPAARARWVGHMSRLLLETITCQQCDALIATRYLGGHRPLFPDLAAHLAHVRSACEALVVRHQAALGRRRTRPERLNLAQLQRQGGADAQTVTDRLVERARGRVLVLLAEQAGELRVERLLEEDDG